MFECYNQAVKYLIEKYPRYTSTSWTSKFRKQLDSAKASERKALEANATDNDKIVSIKPYFIIQESSIDSDDKMVYLLLTQYYFGISVRKELYYKLVELNVIKHLEIQN